MPAAYEYLTLTLGRGHATWQAFATQVNGSGAAKMARAGAELIGIAPQLGFASDEATVLIRWPTGERGSTAVFAGAEGVVTSQVGGRSH